MPYCNSYILFTVRLAITSIVGVACLSNYYKFHIEVTVQQLRLFQLVTRNPDMIYI